MLLPQSRNHEEGEFVQGSAWACFGLLVLTIHQWSSADKDPSRPGGQVREELQKRAQKGGTKTEETPSQADQADVQLSSRVSGPKLVNWTRSEVVGVKYTWRETCVTTQ